MKKAEMTVDFDTYTAMVLGYKVELVTSSSGHCCLPINKCIFGNDMPTTIVLHATEIKQLTYLPRKEDQSIKTALAAFTCIKR